MIPPNDQTDGAGRVQVTVTLQDGETSAVNVNSWFTYVDDNGSSQPLPTVTSVHTYAGPETGGNSVTVYGAGFTGATGVTFGGVPGHDRLDTDTQIKVTVPAFQNGVTTCDQDGSSFDPSQNATNDICQTQVAVTTPNGTSTDSTILPLYEGAFTIRRRRRDPGSRGTGGRTGVDRVRLRAHADDHVDLDERRAGLARERGGRLRRHDPRQGLQPRHARLGQFRQPDPGVVAAVLQPRQRDGHEDRDPGAGLREHHRRPGDLPVTIQSVAGLSNSVNATYAGIPTVSAVQATAGPTAGTNAAPDTGGTPLEIDGSGFANQTLGVIFNDVATPYSLGTQYNFTASSDTKLTTATVAQNPAVVDTLVCTVTDCSAPTSPDNDAADVLFLFPPGDPKIDSITPASGPATGGTQVTIKGQNLGCVTSISFGSKVAADATNAEALLDCGSTDTVTVTAPLGATGKVQVTLHTVESDATGAPPATASFTYTRPPLQTLKVHKRGNGSGKITSSPRGIRCPKTCSHKYGSERRSR